MQRTLNASILDQRKRERETCTVLRKCSTKRGIVSNNPRNRQSNHPSATWTLRTFAQEQMILTPTFTPPSTALSSCSEPCFHVLAS